MVKGNLIKKIGILIVVLCFFAVGIFQLVKYDQVKKAITLSTTMKPQVFTELYFEDHLSLPDIITLFKKYSFKFTIHNLEEKDMEYPYEVYIDTNGEKKLIYEGSALIKDNEYETIAVDLTTEVPLQRSRVIVNLINKNQKIFFWIEQE